MSYVSKLMNPILEEERQSNVGVSLHAPAASTNITPHTFSSPPIGTTAADKDTPPKVTVTKEKAHHILYQLFPSLKPLLKQWYDYKLPPPPPFLRVLTDPIERFFQIKERGSTIETEVQAGIVSFLACLYCIPVISGKMKEKGYDQYIASNTIALNTAIGTTVLGLFTNAPIVLAPTVELVTYMISNMENNNLDMNEGSKSVFFAGWLLLFIGLFEPITRLITDLIPRTLQASMLVGIGLLSTLNGLILIDLVVSGNATLLASGKITNVILISLSSVCIIALFNYYKSKFSCILGMCWGAFVYWNMTSWPSLWGIRPTFSSATIDNLHNRYTVLLFVEISILLLLYIYGIAPTLMKRAGLSLPNQGTIPKGRIILMVVGLMNVLCGSMNGPPLGLLMESNSGIMAGGRTGFTSLVCASLFGLMIFFSPILSSLPRSAVAPILIMIGVSSIRNVSKINFIDSKYAMPCFLTLVLIPFTQSAIDGVSIGYIVYVIIMVVSGDIHVEFNKFMDRYFPQEDILIEEQKVLDELTRKAQQAAQLSLAVEDPEAILLNDPPVALKNPKVGTVDTVGTILSLLSCIIIFLLHNKYLLSCYLLSQPSYHYHV